MSCRYYRRHLVLLDIIKMKCIIVTDIFGCTPELELQVNNLKGPVEILSPYGNQFIPFENEQDAYQHFMTKVGLDGYVSMLNAYIERAKDPLTLLGFSVGASAIWNAAEQHSDNKVIGALLFYSSQIRHSLSLNPNFPIGLIFPKMETHFNVDDVIIELANKPSVNTTKLEYLHGFMNERSQNYDEKGSQKCWQLLSQLSCEHAYHQVELDKLVS